MRRARPWLLCIFVGAALCAGARPAAGQDASEALRPCTAADLIGAWEVIRFGAAPSFPVNRRDPYFYPYQRYVFAANATVRHLTSETRITPERHRTLAAAAPPATWAVNGEGKLLLQHPGATWVESAACAVLRKEVVDPRSQVPALPGDVLLTHYDADKPVMRRQLRKLGGLGE